jgi:hypothetical protein
MDANDTTTATDEKAPSIDRYDVLDSATDSDAPFLTPTRVADHAGGDRDDARAQLEAMERGGLLHSKETDGVRIWWFDQHTGGDLDDVRQWFKTAAELAE